MSMTSMYLLLKPGVTAAAAEGRPGHVALAVDGEATGVVVGQGAWFVAEAFDGTRTAEGVYAALTEEGASLPGADFVLSLAQALARPGLVALTEAPRARPYRRRTPTEVEAVSELRHRCLGCGRSCYGHVIGPLDEAFLERVEGLHVALVEAYPELGAFRPFEKVQTPDGRQLEALTRTRGHCIYLGTDGLCRIHKHHGAEAKPLVCRLFPLTLVQTESSLRIGTPLRCYLAHKSFDGGEPMSTSELTGIPDQELPTPLVRGALSGARETLELNPEPETPYDDAVRLEETVMRLVHLPGATVELLLLAAFELLEGRPLSRAPEHLLTETGFGESVVARLRRLGAEAREVPENHYGSADPGSHYAEMAELLDFLVGVSARPFGGLPSAARRFVLFALRQEIFLREWAKHPSLLSSLVIALVGAIVASWRAEDAGESNEEDVGDIFAFTLTAWSRMMRVPPNIQAFLTSEEDFLDLVGSMER